MNGTMKLEQIRTLRATPFQEKLKDEALPPILGSVAQPRSLTWLGLLLTKAPAFYAAVGWANYVL